MLSIIVTAAVGVLCIYFGVCNMRGNISSLHSYHRHRVKEEDVRPFGQRVGIGMLTIGATLILFSGFTALDLYTTWKSALLVGNIVMGAGFAVGLAITFHAMFKYNKGIF